MFNDRYREGASVKTSIDTSLSRLKFSTEFCNLRNLHLIKYKLCKEIWCQGLGIQGWKFIAPVPNLDFAHHFFQKIICEK